MADPKNPGQFGNRPDTTQQAAAGGHASPGKFGSEKGADPSAVGKMGAEAQPKDAKARGGKVSSRSTSE